MALCVVVVGVHSLSHHTHTQPHSILHGNFCVVWHCCRPVGQTDISPVSQLRHVHWKLSLLLSVTKNSAYKSNDPSGLYRQIRICRSVSNITATNSERQIAREWESREIWHALRHFSSCEELRFSVFWCLINKPKLISRQLPLW